MALTDSESVPFWVLYNAYNAKLYAIQNQRIAIIKDNANSYENLTDAEADELWLRAQKYDTEMAKLKAQYFKKFKKILSAGKAVCYFQTENKIDALVNAQLAIEIPLVDVK